jgi:hypothetical protein
MSDANQIMEEFVRDFQNQVRSELKKRCESYKPDFKTPDTYTAVTALLCRQATLAIELASAPQLWNGHSAPLFLRAMTDVHITVSWILLDPASRAKQYIEHGLGQAVLSVEHRKASLEKAHVDDKPAIEHTIKAEEAWINGQRWSFLVDVNVGSWSGKTTRDMAQEAGCLEFYNYVYTPFSQCAHSTWYHVGRYNSRPSPSPLTSPVWLPQIADVEPHPHDLSLAARYVDKTFNFFDEKALNVPPASKIQDWLEDEIQKRFQAQSDPEHPSPG